MLERTPAGRNTALNHHRKFLFDLTEIAMTGVQR